MNETHRIEVSVAKDEVRADKWLWMVRAFKTRELAAEACRAGRIFVDGREVKPAHTLRPGHKVEVRQGVLTRILVVLAAPKSRQGAAKLGDFLRDETPSEDYALAAEIRRQQGLAAGEGKSDDKRERRALRALRGD
jgi:ribosome-associated heat shock protein Hsp15